MRTPLAAGYVWLVNFWLIAGSHLPKARPANGPLAQLWDLGAVAGKGGLLIAVTFGAYLIGSIIEIRPLHMWEHGGRPRWISRLRNLLRRGRFVNVGVFPVSRQAEKDIVAYFQEDFGYTVTERSDRYPLLAGLMTEELQLATRLQANNAELYGRYDRLLSESAFRINVTPPLLLLVAMLVWGQSIPTWLQIMMTVVAIVGATALFRQGVRAMQSRDIIAQAVVIGLVQPRYLERLHRSEPTADTATPTSSENAPLVRSSSAG